MKILFAASEVAPWVKTGGLADVVSALPMELKKLGHDARVIIPAYASIRSHNISSTKIHESGFSYAGNDVKYSIHRSALPGQPAVPVYLVEQDRGLSVSSMYPTTKQGEQDRFILFGLAIRDWLCHSPWQPHVIHGHDWMAGPLIYQLKEDNSQYATVLTIHNAKYQGEIDPNSIARELSYPLKHDLINQLELGLISATKINTVSPTYAKEILTSEYGYGIESTLNSRKVDLSGIINGIDQEKYSPFNNPVVVPAYTPETATKVKQIHKQELIHQLGLSVEIDKPLFGVVGRTGSQKGMDLFAEALDNNPLLDRANFVIQVGRGTPRIELALENFAKKNAGSVRLFLDFNDNFSHKVFAASDFLIMPSKYEPCGLTQLIAMKYGAVPIVRSTGGLVDTVKDITLKAGNGIVFNDFTASSLLKALNRAEVLFNDKSRLKKIIRRNMEQDFSWTRPATQYIQLYQSALISAKV